MLNILIEDVSSFFSSFEGIFSSLVLTVLSFDLVVVSGLSSGFSVSVAVVGVEARPGTALRFFVSRLVVIFAFFLLLFSSSPTFSGLTFALFFSSICLSFDGPVFW